MVSGRIEGTWNVTTTTEPRIDLGHPPIIFECTSCGMAWKQLTDAIVHFNVYHIQYRRVRCAG